MTTASAPARLNPSHDGQDALLLGRQAHEDETPSQALDMLMEILPMKRFVAPVVALFMMPAVAGTAYTGPLPLASHRAVYDLSLRESEQGGGIENVRVESGCEGYVTNQRMVVELRNVEGGSVVSDFHMSTWESRGGDTLRFSTSNVLNGQQVDHFDGTAVKQVDNGTVIFKDQTKDNMVLPRDVIFPTAYTQQILKSAQEGKNLVSAKIYDGNGHEGLQDSLTVIGKKGKTDTAAFGQKEMHDMSFWNIQQTYFNLEAQTNEPDYEVGLRIFENGVASDLVLKYKDFSMNGQLVELEFLTAAECRQ
jgi:hypothetical protein